MQIEKVEAELDRFEYKTDARLEAWERRTEWPLAAAALIFLAAYGWPILQPHLHDPYRAACRIVDAVVWAVFIVDYVVRLTLTSKRLRWFWTHLLDLASIALPVLRPLRLLRLFVLIRILNRRAADSLHGRIIVYVSAVTVLLVMCGSLAVLQAERYAPGSNIRSYGNALWWAVVTISTVGYGDFYPVTVTGRLVAVAMMLGGIALLGSVTAALASFAISKVQDVGDAVVADVTAQEQGDAAVTRADMAALVDEVRRLRELVEGRETRPARDALPNSN